MYNNTFSEIYFFQDSTVEVLKRNGLKLEDALSFDKVKNCLSMRDLAKLHACAGFVLEVLDISTPENIGSFMYNWSSYPDGKTNDKMSIIDALIKEGSVMIEIRDDLLNNRVRGAYETVEPFQLKPFGDRKTAVIFSNGALSDPRKNVEISRNLVKAMIKGLCVHQEYTTVLRSNLGLRYLNQLFN